MSRLDCSFLQESTVQECLCTVHLLVFRRVQKGCIVPFVPCIYLHFETMYQHLDKLEM